MLFNVKVATAVSVVTMTTTPVSATFGNTKTSSFSAAGSASANKFNVHGMLQELPDTGEQWQTISENGVEFQPAKNLSPLGEYHLRRLTGKVSLDYEPFRSETSPFDKIFVDGTETFYDEYAQAWRALGFYIDCDYCGGSYIENCIDWSSQGNTGQYYNKNKNNNEDDREHEDEEKRGGCQRFMLWAAYIDENYSGGGEVEYAYYNRNKRQYDYTACKKNGNGRCVKMDCHEPDTHFSLLGFFKEPQYDEWMEQLFKHQGDCVWTDSEYQFMQNGRQAWPTGCTQTHISYIQNKKNITLYYDLKPEKFGEMGIALYTDRMCVEEYTGDTYEVGKVLREMVCNGLVDGGDDSAYICGSNFNATAYQLLRQNSDYRTNVYSLESELKQWNRAFDVFKQCQPCKAHDLTNWVAKQKYNYTGSRTNNWNYDNDNDENQATGFVCHDAADYDNVNQCMKFATKTKMMPATWIDIELAGAQGTTTTINLPNRKGQYRGTSRDRYENDVHVALAWLMLFGSAILLGNAYFDYVYTKEELELNNLLIKTKEQQLLMEIQFEKKKEVPKKKRRKFLKRFEWWRKDF